MNAGKGKRKPSGSALRPMWLRDRAGRRFWGVRVKGGTLWSSNRLERPALRGMFHLNYTDTHWRDDPEGRYQGPAVRPRTVIARRR